MTEKPATQQKSPPEKSQSHQNMSPTQASSQQSKFFNVFTLGYHLDGWADLIEGMGAKAEEVRGGVLNLLKEKEMPDVQIEVTNAYVSILNPQRETRRFGTTRTDPGITTIIYVTKHGQDLYVSWRTFVRPMLNILLLFFLFSLSLILGALNGALFENFAFYTDSKLVFYITGLFIGTIIFAFLFVYILTVVGKYLKGDPLAFFFIEPTWFDADDLTAMNLSVHKSILRALDNTGIDVSKLRLKQNFKGGRRDIEV